MAENDFSLTVRDTLDIDANWTDTPPSMDDSADIIQNAPADMKDQFYAEAFREYGEKKSAGIVIKSKSTDEKMVTMDISMKPASGNLLYYYGEIGIRGVLADEILADKITVMSNKLIFRRAKDLVDVYSLAYCTEVRTSDILQIIDSRPYARLI